MVTSFDGRTMFAWSQFRYKITSQDSLRLLPTPAPTSHTPEQALLHAIAITHPTTSTLKRHSNHTPYNKHSHTPHRKPSHTPHSSPCDNSPGSPKRHSIRRQMVTAMAPSSTGTASGAWSLVPVGVVAVLSVPSLHRVARGTVVSRRRSEHVAVAELQWLTNDTWWRHRVQCERKSTHMLSDNGRPAPPDATTCHVMNMVRSTSSASASANADCPTVCGTPTGRGGSSSVTHTAAHVFRGGNLFKVYTGKVILIAPCVRRAKSVTHLFSATSKITQGIYNPQCSNEPILESIATVLHRDKQDNPGVTQHTSDATESHVPISTRSTSSVHHARRCTPSVPSSSCSTRRHSATCCACACWSSAALRLAAAVMLVGGADRVWGDTPGPLVPPAPVGGASASVETDALPADGADGAVFVPVVSVPTAATKVSTDGIVCTDTLSASPRTLEAVEPDVL